MTSLIEHVDDSNFESKVIESNKPVLVDFWAPWCGPCQMISPFIDRIAEEFAGEVLVVKMNIDENREIPSGLGVRSIPYLLTFKDGELIDTIVGAPDPQKLIDMVESLLS